MILFVTNGLDSLGNGRPIGKQDLNTQKEIRIILENLFGEKNATSVSAVFYHGATPTSKGNISFEQYGLFGTYAINDEANNEESRNYETVCYQFKIYAEFQLFQRPGDISQSAATLEFYMFFR